MRERDKTLEQQADELLEEYARQQGVSLRQLGVINQHRQEKLSRREIPLGLLLRLRDKRHKGSGEE